ncbi:MAG: hypothetical protein OEL20_04515 [Sulfuritalea sp.]|nr:hypothetical protein [Sulfuritalea sp.]
MHLQTDLFGHPIAAPPPAPIAYGRRQAAQRALKWNDDGISRLLFDALEYLQTPLLSREGIPEEYRSDRSEVQVNYELADDDATFVEPEIQRVPWGATWIASENAGEWSEEALRTLQVLVFWESMEELTLVENQLEKWSVLKWIFMPAVRKYYVWSQKLGRSRCLEMHENEYAFSFHLCCMAARMNEDEIREGVIRNIHPELHKAVTRVCTF